VQRNFAGGLRHCNELNGTNFYFEQRDRVLNLQDYRRSLDNLAAQGAYNPETRRPWSKQDADARWAQVQKDAVTHQANCAAVASLPFLEKKLKELEQQSGTPGGRRVQVRRTFFRSTSALTTCPGASRRVRTRRHLI
jgi:hypothetical protein